MTIVKKVIYFKDSWLERIVTFSLVGIILISSAFMSGNAQASLTTKAIANSASTNILALDSLQKSMDDAKAELDKFALDTQRYIDKAIADTNKAIERLPEELERAKIYTKFTARAGFKRDMEAREKLLSDAAEYMDNLAKEADSFDKELQRQAEDASSKIDAVTQAVKIWLKKTTPKAPKLKLTCQIATEAATADTRKVLVWASRRIFNGGGSCCIFLAANDLYLGNKLPLIMVLKTSPFRAIFCSKFI